MPTIAMTTRGSKRRNESWALAKFCKTTFPLAVIASGALFLSVLILTQVLLAEQVHSYKQESQAQAAVHRPESVCVILWFDTKDYILPQNDGSAKRIADFLTSQGIRSSFKVVGEKARTA